MPESLGASWINPEESPRATNLNELLSFTNAQLDKYKNAGFSRIGFISGRLRDGEHKQEDERIMNEYASAVENKYGFPVVCSTKIFTTDVWDNLAESRIPKSDRPSLFWDFFTGVIKSGHITDVFMIPGWNEAVGSKKEKEAAIDMNLTIREPASLEQI